MENKPWSNGNLVNKIFNEHGLSSSRFLSSPIIFFHLLLPIYHPRRAIYFHVNTFAISLSESHSINTPGPCRLGAGFSEKFRFAKIAFSRIADKHGESQAAIGERIYGHLFRGARRCASGVIYFEPFTGWSHRPRQTRSFVINPTMDSSLNPLVHCAMIFHQAMLGIGTEARLRHASNTGEQEAQSRSCQYFRGFSRPWKS